MPDIKIRVSTKCQRSYDIHVKSHQTNAVQEIRPSMINHNGFVKGKTFAVQTEQQMASNIMRPKTYAVKGSQTKNTPAKNSTQPTVVPKVVDEKSTKPASPSAVFKDHDYCTKVSSNEANVIDVAAKTMGDQITRNFSEGMLAIKVFNLILKLIFVSKSISCNTDA